MIKHLPVLLLMVLLSLPVSFARAEESELSRLVQEALLNNPDLAAAKARAEQYQYRISQANSLEDPVLSFSFTSYPYDSLNRGEYPMTGDELRLAQKFPFPGKLAAKTGMASGEAGWYQAVYQDARQQVARKVKDAWYRLYYLDRALMVTDRNLALLDDVIRLAEVRYETGQGLQKDVLNAHLQRSRLLEKRLSLVQERQIVQADLNTLLDQPTDFERISPEKLDEEFLDVDMQAYLDAAMQQRPMNQAYESLLERSRRQQKLADLNYYPDVTLWAGWRFRDGGLPDNGTDFVSAGLSVNLPIYRDKRQAATAEADAALRTVQRQFAEFRNQVERNIRDAYSRLVENRDQARLYRQGIIPQSSQTFNAIMSAYQVGKATFTDLLQSLMALYNDELGYHKNYTGYLQSLARLQAEAGMLVQTNTGHENMSAQMSPGNDIEATRTP